MKVAFTTILIVAMTACAQDKKPPEVNVGKALERLQFRSSDVRMYGVVECGLYKIAQSEAPLRKLLESEKDPAVRSIAELALLSISGKEKELTEALRKATKSDNKAIRENCAPFCALLGEKCIALLEDLCNSNPKEYYRFSEGLALGSSADGATLLPYLKSKNKRIRQEACYACSAIFRKSAKYDPRLLSALVEMLADRDGADEEAAKALSNAGPPAVVLLREALRSKDANTRMMAAYGVGGMYDEGEGGTAAEPELIVCLSDPDPKVREEAACAFYKLKLKNPKAIRPLIDCLKHEDHNLRIEAAKALGGMGPLAKEAEAPLLKLAESRESGGHVIEALSRIAPDNQKVVPLVVTLLPDSAGRQFAFAILGDLGLRARSAIKDVRPFRTDKDEDTQAAALGCLLRIGDDPKEIQPHVQRLLKDSWYRPIGILMRSFQEAGDRAKFLGPDILKAARERQDPALRQLLTDSLKKIDPDSFRKLDR